jgi:hypothetical protein
MMSFASAAPKAKWKVRQRLGKARAMDGDVGLIEAVAGVKMVCLWCDTEFEPRRGGSPQRFCHPKCRDAFHSAGRRWAECAVLGGRLGVAELRNGSPEACTLPTREECSADYHPADIAYEERVLSEPERAAARDMLLNIPITAEGLIELCMLGWLDPWKLRDAKAAADAVADLTNAAISLRLHPHLASAGYSK